MPRIRTIKPETFDDPELCELPMEARWLFIGLLTQADKAGRLEDDPRRLQARLLPFDRELDCDQILSWLAVKFILRYVVDGRKFIQIINFPKHQRPHPREAESVIPPPKAVEAVKLHGQPGKGEAEPGKGNDEPGNAGPSRLDTGSGVLESGSGKESRSMAGKVLPDHASHSAKKVTQKPLAYKPRIDVAWPGRPPVPASLHAEFIDKLGGDPKDARRLLDEWYPVAAAPYQDDPIGDDDFAFWRTRFREWVGTTRKSSTPTNRAPGTGAWNRYDEWCNHDPRCATREGHEILIRREQPA